MLGTLLFVMVLPLVAVHVKEALFTTLVVFVMSTGAAFFGRETNY